MTVPRPTILVIIAILTLCARPSLAQGGDNISFVGTWPAGPCYAGTGADRLVCYGEGAFLVTADVTDPAVPVELGRLKLPYLVTQITMRDELAFVETNESLWRIFDLADPSAPQQIGSMLLPSELADVVFVDDERLRAVGVVGSAPRIVPEQPAVLNRNGEHASRGDQQDLRPARQRDQHR